MGNSLHGVGEGDPTDASRSILQATGYPAAQVSRLIFGSRYSLGVILAIAHREPEESFLVQEIARELKSPWSQVHTPIKKLERLGDVLCEDPMPRDNAWRYHRLDTEFWQAGLPFFMHLLNRDLPPRS